MKKVNRKQFVKVLAVSAAGLWCVFASLVCMVYIYHKCDELAEWLLAISATVPSIVICTHCVINVVRSIVALLRKQRKRTLTLVDLTKDTIVSYRAD
jgi:biotin transporter BioY